MSTYILSVDQGTTSSRAMLFNTLAEPIDSYQMNLTQYYPHNGWVEQDPEELWQHTLTCCQEVMKKANLSNKKISALGITNQRETTLIWDRKTGRSIYPAIVWQDRRTAEMCESLLKNSISKTIQNKTGLLLDSYFSATKISWILDNIPGARTKADKGELAFGTIDAFLLWRFTKGKIHATDASNASRTLLFNIHTQTWDSELLNLFNIPASLLPAVLNNAENFGEIDSSFLGESIPISAMIGDQQAAGVGQACLSPGMMKVTYGTGGFILLNSGDHCIESNARLLSTIAYRLSGKTTYCIEGTIFSAGTIIKWLRDSLNIISSAAESEEMAKRVTDTNSVYFVPAFTGLGAPYWDPNARAGILGLTSNSTKEHIVRAGLESICYQTRDLLECLRQDGVNRVDTLRVDGGMAANNWLLQFLADMLGITVERPQCIETTAKGAMLLAGLQSGLYQSIEEISSLWKADRKFEPSNKNGDRELLYDGWKLAVKKVLL